MKTLETYRGVPIIRYQDRHHEAGKLSIGWVPPTRGKYGALTGSPTCTINDIKQLIDRELDQPKAITVKQSQNQPQPKMVKGEIKMYEKNEYIDSMGVGKYTPCTEAEATEIIKQVAELMKLSVADITEQLNEFAVLPYSKQSNYYYTCTWKTIRTIQRPEKKSVQMIKCSCGHTVPSISVMSASMGTACPDCYDNLSD